MSRFRRAAASRRERCAPLSLPSPRRVVQLIVALAIVPAAVRAAHAQAITTVALSRTAEPPCAAIFADPADSAHAPSDAAAPCTTLAGPEPIARSRSKLPFLFYGGLAVGLAANSFAHVDRDPGGYQDSWATESYFPDKGVHALSAFALTTVGVDLKLSPWKSAAAVCAAGALFETTQGYVSGHDIAADCIGAGLAGLWRHWRAR